MLYWQKEHIRKNKVTLLQQIKCTTVMLEKHLTLDDISFEECDNLKCMQGNTDKVSTLLGLLETRTNGYEHLIDSLKVTKQSDALKTLTDHPNTKELVETGKNEAAQGKADSLVGDEGFGIGDIVLHVEDSPVGTGFLLNWMGLARRLNITDSKREELNRAVESNKKRLPDVFEDILRTWRNQQGKKATIGSLINCIKACGSTEIAESLTKTFLD